LFGSNYKLQQGSDPNLLALSTGFVALFLVGWSPFFWGFGRSILLGEENSNSNSRSSTTTITITIFFS